MNTKCISSKEAADLIHDNAVVAVNGFVGFGHPEELSIMLEERFIREGHPKDLTLIYGAGQGDGKTAFGLNHFAHKRMTRRVICGHIGLATELSALVARNEIEGYNFPQGVITHLFRAIAGGKMGVFTHVGLHTFADPRIEGCKMNDLTKEDLVELLHINGQEQLLYKAMPIDVALIRGTTADLSGNITMEKEAMLLETLSIAQAVKNSGGIVIAQVERVASEGTLNPQAVVIPGINVDYLVVAKPENHKMSFNIAYNPALSGEVKIPLHNIPPMKFDQRKIIAKRCAFELKPDAVVNLGIGVPDGIASISIEEEINDCITLSIESGVIGGVPCSGLKIGASTNAVAIIDHPYQFDHYDGGGLDIAYLGLAQADPHGNINVSKFNGKSVGCGGFVNITQNAKKVVFCGTFTAGGLKTTVKDGMLVILQEGKYKKFVPAVEQITFSGQYAALRKKPVIYVTERAVFSLNDKGMVLTEIAPGIDLQKDILDLMDFAPIIKEPLKIMDSRIFSDRPMMIKEELLAE